MRSTAGSSSAPSREDWLSNSRAILPSAQSDAPLNISTATAQPVGVGDQQQVQEDRTSTSRSTLSALGTVSTRSPGARSCPAPSRPCASA